MWDWACRSSAQINYVRKLSLIALVKAGMPAVAPKERRLVEVTGVEVTAAAANAPLL